MLRVRSAAGQSLVLFIFDEGGRTRDTALSFGASGGSGERNVDAGDRAGDGAGDAIFSPFSFLLILLGKLRVENKRIRDQSWLRRKYGEILC